MKEKVIVIGAGAAGLMAAGTAAERGFDVLLIERNDKVARKVMITGKGRCNVTNDCAADQVLRNIPRNGRFLFSALAAHNPADVMAFFEDNGCALKTERGNRVFPVSDRSQSVLDSLTKAMKMAGVTVQKGRVKKIEVEDGVAKAVCTDEQRILCKWVILATGGLSYPTTGSTGDGLNIAKQLGHEVTQCEGSLVPLEVLEKDCMEMQGLSLRNVAVKLVNEKGKALYKDFGELLFTHFGISGPTVLSASAHLKGNCVFAISLSTNRRAMASSAILAP